jgi:MoaA/NifB/PqqE/SkfB family radical SAM enzyme
MNGIRLFREERSSRGIAGPKIHLVFLMVKDNILEVPSVPSFAREVGVEEVVLTNICHTINRWQESQRVFVWERDGNEYEGIVRQAETNARKLHIKLRRPSLCVRDAPVCDENPLRNLYISANGEISPCVYLYPPLPSPFRRIFSGREYWVEKVNFGNIFRTPFVNIWNQGDYEHFRGRFAERKKKFRDLYYSLWDSTTLRNFQGDILPAPPEPCRNCHKIIGV